MTCRALVGLALISTVVASPALPSLDEALAAKEDLWGLAAIGQTNGPSYEFFRDLLPPLRYVNAEFKYYPLVLSAPGALVKARLTSNGSSLNARAGLKTWKEIGTPWKFFVGDDLVPFGEGVENLVGPTLQNGFLPLVTVAFTHHGTDYEEEAFAAIEPEYAKAGAVCLRFSARRGQGTVAARFNCPGALTADQTVCVTNGSTLAFLDKAWRWDQGRHLWQVEIKPDHPACLVVFTEALTNRDAVKWDRADYARHRAAAISTWNHLVDAGTQLETPEPLVNNAWRAILCACFSLRKGNAMNYSSGNAYDRLYQAECGDTVRAVALYGHAADAAAMIPSLLRYTRDSLKYHNAGFKLQTLSHYYWLTRDQKFLDQTRELWSSELDKILDGREKDSGLFPREAYCGDISTKVYSLHSNGAGWRGLRDFAAVLQDVQSLQPHASFLPAKFEPSKLAKIAAEFRHSILAASGRTEFTNTRPPFIPVALFGEEKPVDPLTSTMLGSYWDLMAPYMLGSGFFGTGSVREKAIIDYLHEHGGIFMGLLRFDQHSGLFANENAVDDLYGLRYTLKLLELDDVDRALVSFYGKLAQGLTPDTFVGAEGTGLRPLDAHGRAMYLPPNSTAGAYYLWMLRYLLVQDWDTDDDGRPDTLRLAFATPQTWLNDGRQIKIANAPSAFGPVSYRLKSDLRHGRIIADVGLPTRNRPTRTLLRARVPSGWRVISAEAGDQIFSPDSKGTIDITNLRGKSKVVFRVSEG